MADSPFDPHLGGMTLFELLPSSRHGLNPHLDRAIWPLSSYVDELGRLCVGGVAATEIAAEFGTPTYVVDEEDFRARIRCVSRRAPRRRADLCRQGAAEHRGGRVGGRRRCGVDVCSGGELATALAGGVPPSRIILHGNAKTAGELHDAVAAGVGRIVIDSPSEIALLAAPGASSPTRAGPGDSRHRHRGAIGGSTRNSALLWPAARRPARSSGCWISRGWTWSDCTANSGRSSSDAGLYGEAIRQMIAVMAEVRDRHQVVLTELNLGGGHAFPYLSGDPESDLRGLGTSHRCRTLESACARIQLSPPADRDRAGPSDRRPCRDDPVPGDRRQTPARRTHLRRGRRRHERQPAGGRSRREIHGGTG